MRFVLIVSMLLSTAATGAVSTPTVKPKFKKGDCVQDLEDLESWETPKFAAIKILDIGVKKYKTAQWIPEEKRFNESPGSDPIWLIDSHYTKVRCPK